MKNFSSTIFIIICLLSLVFASTLWAQDTALQKAKLAVKAYFDAILAGESTLSPNIAMATAIENVPEKDQSALQEYYDQVSLASARQAVDAYVQKVSTHQDASPASDRMHEIEDALSPENLEKIKRYFNQKVGRH